MLLLTPAIRPFSFRRLLFTYLIPVVPPAVMWDGIVSVLRTYTVDEVNAIIATVPGADTYRWEVALTTEGRVTLFHAIGQPR